MQKGQFYNLVSVKSKPYEFGSISEGLIATDVTRNKAIFQHSFWCVPFVICLAETRQACACARDIAYRHGKRGPLWVTCKGRWALQTPPPRRLHVRSTFERQPMKSNESNELSKIFDKTAEIRFVRVRPVVSDPTRSVTTDTTFPARISAKRLAVDTTDNLFFFFFFFFCL